MKKFKMAQIVPIAHLEDVKDKQYHMCLAHIAVKNIIYKDFYKRMADEGKFVLLDNGVAEFSQLDNIQLLKVYQEINPTEIVLPDTICECVDTLRKTLSFIYKYQELPYRFMGVPQGKNIREWLICAKAMLLEPRINTIGISKFLNLQTGDRYARYIVMYELIKILDDLKRNDIEVHLLGCEEGPKIVKHIHETFSIVRGCDSSFVYIATKTGSKISEEMDRPNEKIDFLNSKVYYDRYKENVKAFEKIVGAEE